jgi:hypothetical protein
MLTSTAQSSRSATTLLAPAGCDDRKRATLSYSGLNALQNNNIMTYKETEQTDVKVVKHTV